MRKNKMRNMRSVGGQSQDLIEKGNIDQSALQELVHSKENIEAKKTGIQRRVSPQLSCTIQPEDKEMLTSLTLYLSNKKRKLLNTSTLIRALIKLGNKYRDQLEF